MVNIVKIGKKYYKYESVWRDKKNLKVYDSKNNLFPWPKPVTPKSQAWQNKEILLIKLSETMNHLRRKNKFEKYPKSKDCLLCRKKNVSTGLFTLNNFRWEDGLHHYIDIHNIKPSDEFIDMIFRYEIDPHIISRSKIGSLKGVTVIKENKKYLKIGRNQIFIMDALMRHGSYKRYVDSENRSIFRYSEHAGLIDFNNSGVEKIIISGKTTRVDKFDSSIYQPKNMLDMFDYEYIFHTHPATPTPGGRVELGILYEFPSISDIFHFIDHYNGGKTQGSIVIAPEGMYIIRKHIPDDKKIKINEDKFYKEIMIAFENTQEKAINKYGIDFSTHTFYSKISSDKKYINEINKVLNKYQLHIDYYSRIRDKMNRWVIDTVYVPIYVIEPEKQSI